MPLLDEVATLLGAAGLGTVGSTIVKGILPDASSGPDPVLGVLDYAAAEPLRRLGGDNAGTLAERARLQVLIRGADYPTVRARAQAVVAACDWLGPRMLTASSAGPGTAYAAIAVLQRPPLMIGRDQNDRWRFTVNLECTRAPSP